MKPEIQDKLQDIVVAVINHLKSLNTPGKGAVDVALLSSQVVNYLIERHEIKLNEKIEYYDHILKLINITLNNTMLSQDILFLKNEMLKNQGYSLLQVLKIYNQI